VIDIEKVFKRLGINDYLEKNDNPFFWWYFMLLVFLPIFGLILTIISLLTIYPFYWILDVMGLFG